MDPYVGEIRLFAGNFAPRGWAFCNGQILSVPQFQALYSVLGNIYGGEQAKQTFALPDLRNRVPLSQGQGPGLSLYPLGQSGGEATVNLPVTQVPTHTHVPQCIEAVATASTPQNGVWAAATGSAPVYNSKQSTPDTSMNPNALQSSGGGLPHNNLQPNLGLNFIIATEGIYPIRQS